MHLEVSLLDLVFNLFFFILIHLSFLEVPWGLNEQTLNVLNIFNTELPSGVYVTMF